jgi:hypothetical protein
MQKNFQPTGFVNSVYGQSNQGFNQQQTAGYGNFAGAAVQNYHTANYRGNQDGHDSYLRADSRQPSQSQFGGISNVSQSSFAPSMNTFNATSSFNNAGVSYSQNQNQNQSQFVSPESYHTANYQGNQEGHDSYLRGDSRQPSQSQFGTGVSGANFGQAATSSYNNVNANLGTSSFRGGNLGASSFGASNLSSNFGASNIGTSGFGSNVSSFSQNQNQQFTSPESYHTANYKGNQDGHDSYLRSDSRQPVQSQFGAGMTSGSYGSFTGNRF